ncbi:MAG: STAS domain-containing protein [Candidatus Andersenbacteria bacterium]
MHNQSYEITTEKVGDVTVVHFVGDQIMSELQVQELGKKLKQLIEGGCEKVVVNFRKIEFMSSAFLGKLITLQKIVDARFGNMVFCRIRPEIYEVFAITKLNKLFSIKDEEVDALAAM